MAAGRGTKRYRGEQREPDHDTGDDANEAFHLRGCGPWFSADEQDTGGDDPGERRPARRDERRVEGTDGDLAQWQAEAEHDDSPRPREPSPRFPSWSGSAVCGWPGPGYCVDGIEGCFQRGGAVGGAPHDGEHDGYVDPGVAVLGDGRCDGAGGAGDADGVEHPVGDGSQGGRSVAGGVGVEDGVDFVVETGSSEAAGVGVDHDVGEQIATCLRRSGVAVGDTDVHVGVDGGLPAGADLVDTPRDVLGGEVVEQHAVGVRATEAEHVSVESAEDDLGSALAHFDTETESPDGEEVAFEGHGFTGEALAQQRQELAGVGDRAGRERLAVPVGRDHWRGDTDPEQDVGVGRRGPGAWRRPWPAASVAAAAWRARPVPSDSDGELAATAPRVVKASVPVTSATQNDPQPERWASFGEVE